MIRMNVFYLWEMKSYWRCSLAFRMLFTESWNEDIARPHAQHMENGLAVARFLENHPSVERVLHPGLPSHPQHELAQRQCYGHSGMVTFFLNGAGKNECRAFVKGLKVVILGESLGGYESLVKIPALMPESYQLNVPVNLIRLAVGLEYVGDLIEDLDQALIRSTAVQKI